MSEEETNNNAQISEEEQVYSCGIQSLHLKRFSVTLAIILINK
jgi:hypothetical protein